MYVTLLFEASSNIACWRANNKLLVEVMIVNLENTNELY